MKLIFFAGLFCFLGTVCNGEVAQAANEVATPFDYTVAVAGKSILVNTAAINLLRDWDAPAATTVASFSSFELPAKASVVIHSKVVITNAVVRPLSAGIVATISSNGLEARLLLARPQNLMVEFNGITDLASYNGKKGRLSAPALPLFLFANPKQRNAPQSGQTGLIYFGPGLHDAGHLHIKSDETIFLAEGAVVYGTIEAKNSKNISILGRGILDGSKTKQGSHKAIDLYHCTNATIEGIIIRDSPHWTIVPTGCRNVTVRNVKIINIRSNGDGIDPCNSRDVFIQDCFLCTSDDCVSPKGCAWFYQNVTNEVLENINVSDCFMMNTGAGNAVRVGEETVAPVLRNVTIRNCDVYTGGNALEVSAADRGLVRNIVFDNLRVERYSGYTFRVFVDNREFSYDKDKGLLGDIDGVRFKNIEVQTYSGSGAGIVSGFDAGHKVRNVTFKHMMVGGNLQTQIDTFPGGIYPNSSKSDSAFRENILFEP